MYLSLRDDDCFLGEDVCVHNDHTDDSNDGNVTHKYCFSFRRAAHRASPTRDRACQHRMVLVDLCALTIDLCALTVVAQRAVDAVMQTGAVQGDGARRQVDDLCAPVGLDRVVAVARVHSVLHSLPRAVVNVCNTRSGQQGKVTSRLSSLQLLDFLQLAPCSQSGCVLRICPDSLAILAECATGPIHTGRGTRRVRKFFDRFSFDVACVQ